MKPTQNIRPGAQKFPLVDYCYHAPMLNGSSAPVLKHRNHCATSRAITSTVRRDREFVSEAAVFTTLIVVMAVVPIVAGVSAMLRLFSTLPLF